MNDQSTEAVPLWRRDRRLVLMLALALLWAVELFVVQGATLDYAYPPAPRVRLNGMIVRWVLDCLFSATVVFLLPTLLWPLAFAVGLLFEIVVLTYFAHFDQGLSLRTVLAQFNEGLAAWDAVLVSMEPLVLVLFVAFALKLAIWSRIRHAPASTWGRRRAVIGLLCLLSYLVVIAAVDRYRRPIERLRTWVSVGDLGAVYGYLPVWVGELLYLDNATLLARALERGEERADRLTAVEAPLPVHDRLVFLQIESFDSALLSFDVDGRRVVPNLVEIAERSMRFRVRSPHGAGSGDADFTALMGKFPSPDVSTYKISGYPYDDSFVGRLDEAGFHTAAFHGVSGRFYERRVAYRQMGFDELFFREDFPPQLDVRPNAFAIPDGSVLDLSSERLVAADEPTFHMVITATSHLPFDHLPIGEDLYFPGSPSPFERFLDSMAYVDRSVAAYVEALPGGVTAVIYGDHASHLAAPDRGFVNPEYGGVGLVPFLIYDTSRDLSELQRTRDEPIAMSGELHLLDAISYVHRWVLDER